MTREVALGIPAVQKARDVLIQAIAPRKLVVRTTDGPVEKQPTWAYRTDGQDPSETPYIRMAGIIDDGFFYGDSLLAVDRGAAGQVLRIGRVPRHLWKIDAFGRILVDDKPVDSTEVVYVRFPHEGLLAIGGDVLRGALNLRKAWEDRTSDPVPTTVLKDTEATERTAAEIAAIKKGYADQRKASSVAYVPYAFEVEFGKAAEGDFYQAAQNAVTTYIGQLVGIRASMLDGTLADSSSLTYVTQEGERSAFFALDVPFWSRAIEDRLSQDDVVPAGQSVAFDFSDLFAGAPLPLGAPRED